MASPRLALLVAAAAVVADVPSPLKVIRITPQGDADPATIVTVTFDRPVAGSLDRTVDPRSVLRFEPAVPGTYDWRDPVTVRFRPAAPLAPGLELRGTVPTTFQAMDGSQLAEAKTFSFRVRGPRILSGLPAGPDQAARFLPPDARFEIVLSAPADSATASSFAGTR